MRDLQFVSIVSKVICRMRIGMVIAEPLASGKIIKLEDSKIGKTLYHYTDVTVYV